MFRPFHVTFCVMLDCERLLKIKAIFSCTFSGGSTILSVWSVATSSVSMLVVLMEGYMYKEGQLSLTLVFKHYTFLWCRKVFWVLKIQSQTHRYILLEAAGCRSCDCGGLAYRGGSCCRGDKSAGLTRLWDFGDTRLLWLGLGLNLCQCQTAWGSDGTLHLHWRVPWLLAILDILHTQYCKEQSERFNLSVCGKPCVNNAHEKMENSEQK